MRGVAGLLVGVVAAGMLLVLGHMGLNGAMHAQTEAGRLAARTCASCH